MLPSRIFFDDLFDDMEKPKRNLMKCDISEKDGKFLIEMDLPGMKKEDIKMELENGYLTIKVIKSNKESDFKKYIRRERVSYTNCSRQFYVGDISDDEIKATFNDGILCISVPKEEEKITKKTINID